ncbi:hypothetical protein EC957_004406 [Mortierella hygrophila]|uniref:Uncharacterized protein n=1 Tax=Mortierella hygrophila TaxID=979708 RepID=A0A9P6F1M5_9FUNG|nr:hypothetical protein EC957_004406 [Mortierella hygrophila]
MRVREASTFKPSQFKDREISVEPGASVRNTTQSDSFAVDQKTEDIQRQDEGMDDDIGTHTDSSIAHKIQPVMSAMFFATIGFVIPLTKILEPVLFGWGVVYVVIATLLKLTTMIAVPPRISSPEKEDLEDGVSDNRYNAQ